MSGVTLTNVQKTKLKASFIADITAARDAAQSILDNEALAD